MEAGGQSGGCGRSFRQQGLDLVVETLGVEKVVEPWARHGEALLCFVIGPEWR